MARRNWKPAFLANLELSGKVTDAAEAAGVSRRTVYRNRKRFPDFADQWDESIEIADYALEAEARRRGSEGFQEAVYHNGKIVGYNNKYSDTLLIFLLNAHKPEKYRANYTMRHEGKLEVDASAECGLGC